MRPVRPISGRLRYPGPMVSDSAELARRIASNIDRFRIEAGLTMSDLIAESGMSRSAFYSRLRNETTWPMDALAEIAAIFAVDPVELLTATSGDGTGLGASGLSADVLVSCPTLSRRIDLLVGAGEHPGGVEDLLAQLRESGVALSGGAWKALIAGSGRARVGRVLIDAIADYFDVDAGFLAAPDADPAADLLEAQLELRGTLRKTGGRVGLRSLADVPAEALRAIARSLRP